MALRITRSAEPIKVERLNVCLYAPPGIGKTSLSFTSDSPLLLDFDRGAHRAANRKDIVQVASWGDVTAINEDDLAPYKTVVVDTVGRALDVLSADIIRRNSKMGRGGSLTLQGYGQLKAEFVSWLKMVNGLGKDVILIAHMDEQRNGDEIVERLDVQGGSKGEIYKAADAMGRIAIRDGKRWLNFSPTDASFGKNPGQMEPLLIPNKDDPDFTDFLAGVIKAIKDRLNDLTEEQAVAQKRLETLRTALADVSDAEGVNGIVAAYKAGTKAEKALIHHKATELGLSFNKAAEQYEAEG